jgi:omega-amidase
VKLACCQLNITWEDKEANYERVESLVAAAGLAPGTLLLLPELFATGFTMNARAVAETLDGPTAAFLADLARRHHVWVQGGLVLGDAGSPIPRNESLVFTPEGKLAARYAKMHLFSFAREPEHYAPGGAPVVFAWEDSLVAPAICYDLRFPELFRHAAAQRAEVLTVIACWPAAREEHWLALLRARAIENQCYVAAVNRCGADPSGLAYSGRSQIIDPRGVVLADAGNGERIIEAEIDLAELRGYRRQFPALRDRRL